METTKKITSAQWIRLIVGPGIVIYGMYHIAMYTLGYPISLSIPGTSLHGSGSKVVSLYGIIAIVGGVIFRSAYDKIRASKNDA